MAKEIAFENFAKGMTSGWVDHAGVVIRDEKQMQWMWKRFYAHALNPAPIPEIDFSKVMLICSFRGQYSTWGYSTEIKRIVEASDAHSKFLRVYILECNPRRGSVVKDSEGKLLFAQPFHIVELERSKKPVHFKYSERICWR